MALTETRKGEIALLVLINKMSKVGVRVSKETKRTVNNQALAMGINPEELMNFQAFLTMEILKKVFPQNNFKNFEDKLSDEKKGQLAILIIKEDAIRNGVTISKEIIREFKNVAKEIAVTEEEIVDFVQEIIGDLLEKVF